MKKWEVQVHKRYQYQSNTMYYGTFSNWQDATEYEYVEAEYFIVTENEGLEFYIFTTSENAHLYLVPKQYGVLICAYHANQWLSVSEYKENGTEYTTETVQ